MKIRPTILVVGLCVGIFTSLHAQQHLSIGMRGGLTIPHLSAGGGNPISNGYSSIEGVGFGVFAEFKVSNLFSIQPMLEYSQEGGKRNGMQAIEEMPSLPDNVNELLTEYNNDITPKYISANVKNKARLDYLLLPILAKFGWDLGRKSHWRVYADIGPTFGLLLRAKTITSGTSLLYLYPNGTLPVPDIQDPSQTPEPMNLSATTNVRDSTHRFNFGIEGNVGIAYKFKRSSVFLEGGGNYGLLNIQKNTADGKNHSGAATIMIGYSLSLGK